MSTSASVATFSLPLLCVKSPSDLLLQGHMFPNFLIKIHVIAFEVTIQTTTLNTIFICLRIIFLLIGTFRNSICRASLVAYCKELTCLWEVIDWQNSLQKKKKKDHIPWSSEVYLRVAMYINICNKFMQYTLKKKNSPAKAGDRCSISDPHATEQLSPNHNSWAWPLEPRSHNCGVHVPQLLKPFHHN